jgi:condensin complex subunit 1
MNKILDSITSGLQMEANRARVDVESEPDTQVVQAHRAPLEMYAFLLRWFAEAAEKVKAAGDDDMAPKARRGKGSKAAGARAAARKETWTWEEYVPATLGLIFKVLRIKTLRIWTTTPERDAFIE